MAIRLIVFDLDGTLVDSSTDLASGMNAALAKVAPGKTPLPLPKVRSFIGNGARTLVERSLREAGVALPVEAVLPVFLECYGRCLLDTTRLYPGVLETLDALRELTLAVLTNKPGDMSRRILQGLSVADRFAFVVGAGDVPERKPDPAGLHLLCQRTGATAAETLIVGDSSVDVKTGRAAGVRTVGVSYGLDPESLIECPPDWMLNDLRDLPAVVLPSIRK